MNFNVSLKSYLTICCDGSGMYLIHSYCFYSLKTITKACYLSLINSHVNIVICNKKPKGILNLSKQVSF